MELLVVVPEDAVGVRVGVGALVHQDGVLHHLQDTQIARECWALDSFERK